MVHVRVEAARLPEVRLLDLGLGRGALQAEDLEVRVVLEGREGFQDLHAPRVVLGGGGVLGGLGRGLRRRRRRRAG